ncbi:formyltetrahydrofolate deformylase [Pseudonocardia abyssalis]|uniref:Formyltetrahydrofolate deformylase n=1 Tax=Pseudonocardia abyssalis TaxID=2792008 RepID=A0ABS6UPN5_9PSEU|nr:formyltetrahydrofolate deformylase [Pseudonocardia abyssalis]MBW0115106.1 formyltetrahydrofolate deformylase [Pseudonocardia abyssalis]MBW0133754.1 formyltetrahydrofolate deformylase [Pseudonocardia abyssalis]
MSTPGTTTRGVLLLSCPDAPGIVHAVSGLLVEEGCTILSSQQFGSLLGGSVPGDGGTFFMRVEFTRADGAPLDLPALRLRTAALADRFGMTWRLVDPTRPLRVVVMVSRLLHCLNDLLFRSSVGEPNLDVVAVVSNHPDAGRLADSHGVAFRHIPVTADTKGRAEAELLDLVDRERVDLVVLARYMQILSDDACKHLEGRAINIHHSMLPSFKGARPYHQAHVRGVKFIGATAHYATADLDEGPIIEQDLVRVDHSLGPEQLAARGREVESRALARAVRWHAENRIAVHGNRTVVFP